MAALREAVSECSTAKQRLAYADPNDGILGLLVLDARYGTTKAAANRHVKLKKLLWREYDVSLSRCRAMCPTSALSKAR